MYFEVTLAEDRLHEPPVLVRSPSSRLSRTFVELLVLEDEAESTPGKKQVKYNLSTYLREKQTGLGTFRPAVTAKRN